ncbi:unnamed protein product [Closterium sp. Yama58-4]|nr:unnamed protein product [Closterium sp. Yama58-4]
MAASGRRALSIDIDSVEKPSAGGGGRSGGDDGADDAALGAAMPKTPSERVRAIIMQAASEREDAVKAESRGKQRAAELHAKRLRSRRGGIGSSRRAGNNASSNSLSESDRDAASSDALAREDDAASTGTGGGGGGGGENYDSLVDSGYGDFVADRDDFSDYQGSESGSHNDEIHGGFHGVSISPIRAGPMGPRFGGTSPGSPANSESHLFRRGPKGYSDAGTPMSDDGRSAAGGDVAEDNFGETGEGGVGDFYGQRKVGNGYIQMNAAGTVASGFTLLDMGGKRQQYGGYYRVSLEINPREAMRATHTCACGAHVKALAGTRELMMSTCTYYIYTHARA